MNQEHSALHDKQQEILLASALSRHFNTTIHISIEIVTEAIITPHKTQQQKANKALANAHESLQQNPHFRQILEQFNAIIVPGSIMSLEDENSTNEV